MEIHVEEMEEEPPGVLETAFFISSILQPWWKPVQHGSFFYVAVSLLYRLQTAAYLLVLSVETWRA